MSLKKKIKQLNLKEMERFTLKRAKETSGLSYLGGCRSSKLLKSLNKRVLTYGIYLAPSNLSGYNVCPNSEHCRANCLNASGRNKIEILSGKNHIQRCRIEKTRLFFQRRELFVRWMCYEIKRYQSKSKKLGYDFSVRINCTSDITPELMRLDGMNILQIFSNVQFYDYTKVASRMRLMDKYPNYDLTFSYNGYNWDDCERFLKEGKKVAVVFEGALPKTFCGYKVVNANNDDVRYLNKGGEICGLTYHRVASDYKNGNFNGLNTRFVVMKNDSRCEF